MARRKRASMREGPLADLFRSTVEPDDPPEAPPAPYREPEPEESVRAYRVEEERAAAPPPPAAKERLSRIFDNEHVDVEGPAFGRDEPRYRGEQYPGGEAR